jgi:LacI family transcriptional regulator
MTAVAGSANGHGRSRPTMRDVAARAGVSLKTVSRVVNGEAAIAPATMQRVNEAIEELGFLRNDLARSLRSKGGSRMIGLVIEDLSNPFYSGIAKGLEEEATARGYMVVIASSEEDAARERDIIGALCSRRVEGIVLVPAGKQHKYLQSEMDSGLKVVFVDRPPGRIGADTLLLDNRGASRTAVETLVDEGHRKIALVSDAMETYAVGERVRGYREALTRRGLKPNPRLECIGAHTAERAENAAEELLSRAHPTAIFCTNNRTAIGVVRAVVRARADVAIIGFDDFELADLLPIRIRVLRHDPTELGRQAGLTLFARIDGVTAPPARAVVTPELVWRGVEPG